MRLLLLAGTHEARHIAVALSRESYLRLSVSLPAPERNPRPFGWPVRIGGWGGEEPFRRFLKREGIEAIIDATHPFARGMSHRAARVADEMGIDHVQFLRPAWMPSEGDNWIFLNSEAEAANHIPPGKTVFLSTGRRELDAFRNIPEARLICRIRDWTQQPFPFGNGRFLYQQGPFRVADEVALFERLGVDWVIARNSGGPGSWPKIEAARELGLPVAMVRRPRQPDGLKIASVAETLAWVRRRL
ncbi:cobalt-precorrin-6A reductase [Alphaproteobacteria bacterium GH1-50]|uniref:Cobalt-precorrin-6A reductase n=1 Tax=Kangsaoukella pontilimi TaxID=2691042 RepID=A0A7C9IR13_9RHOB|nr:precorrin-6A/cobalt-precorrin-6A reductase [Kangsaoukella pontilimi]MXQ06926.1 cobalt-precorrin-6A reductase [Kangsaoukella pontilimi]